jgi:hypothetical protein
MDQAIMRKFTINNEKKSTEPSNEQLARHKDFASLSHRYERLTKRPKKPLYKDPKLFLLLFLLGIIFLVLFLENV